MHHDEPLVEARIARLVRDRIDPAVHRRSAPVTVDAWQVPDEPVPFAEAVAAEYTPFTVGEAWGGRPWGTTWFRVRGTVPEDFGVDPGTTVELRVDLGFSKRQPGFQAEGLAWRTDGSTIKGIEPRNDTVPVEVGPGGSFELYVEAARTRTSAATTSRGRPRSGRVRRRVPNRSTACAHWSSSSGTTPCGNSSRTSGCSADSWPSCRPTAPGARTSCAASSVRRTPSTPTTSPAAPPRPARCSRRCSPWGRPDLPGAPSPSGTPTSTPPGSGRCARRSASARARSRTCST